MFAADAHAVTTDPAHPAGLTADEMDDLTIWGHAHGLEVVIDSAGEGFPVEVAYVGYGYGLASWTLHRGEGHLWLARIANRSGQPCENWLGTVSSVEEAIAKITLATEA